MIDLGRVGDFLPQCVVNPEARNELNFTINRCQSRPVEKRRENVDPETGFLSVAVIVAMFDTKPGGRSRRWCPGRPQDAPNGDREVF